jgi:hypothetical protein
MRFRAVPALAAFVLAVLPAAPARAAEHTYKTAHFALTWSDGGAPFDKADADGDGVPDAIVRMATTFETVRSIEIDELGYQAPPTHGRYDLYVAATDSHGLTRVGPGGTGRSRPSFIVIPPSMMDATAPGILKAFAGHSYFHAIQLGYDAAEDLWIKEATAAWMEGIVAPHTHNNFAYLYAFTPHLELGIASESGFHEYGAFLFFQFLTERYFGGARAGAEFLRDLWEDLAAPEAREGSPDYGGIEGVRAELEQDGISLVDAWREFLLWNWQVRRFERGAGYSRELRLERWPSAPATELADESCRMTTTTPEPDDVPGLSGGYARFVPARDVTSNARLVVEGPPDTVALAIVAPAKGASTVRLLSFDSSGVAVAELGFGGAGARRVTVAVGNGSTSPSVSPAFSLRLADGSATSVTPPGVPSSTIYGTGFTATGQVSCGGRPAPFADVVLRQQEVTSGAVHEVLLTTDPNGAWSYTTTPSVISTFSVRVADPLLSVAQSPDVRVEVRVAVNISISDDQIAEGEAITVEGTVAPAHEGRIVVERRRPNGQWELAAETTADSSGGYRTDVMFPATGLWEVRATMPSTGDADHAPGDSAPKAVQVGES